MTTSEAARNFGKVIRRVLRGETIELTSRGELIARISPVGGPENHEQAQRNTTGAAAGEAGSDTVTDGHSAEDVAERGFEDRVGGVARRDPSQALGAGVQADPS